MAYEGPLVGGGVRVPSGKAGSRAGWSFAGRPCRGRRPRRGAIVGHQAISAALLVLGVAVLIRVFATALRRALAGRHGHGRARDVHPHRLVRRGRPWSPSTSRQRLSSAARRPRVAQHPALGPLHGLRLARLVATLDTCLYRCGDACATAHPAQRRPHRGARPRPLRRAMERAAAARGSTPSMAPSPRRAQVGPPSPLRMGAAPTVHRRPRGPPGPGGGHWDSPVASRPTWGKVNPRLDSSPAASRRQSPVNEAPTHDHEALRDGPLGSGAGTRELMAPLRLSLSHLWIKALLLSCVPARLRSARPAVDFFSAICVGPSSRRSLLFSQPVRCYRKLSRERRVSFAPHRSSRCSAGCRRAGPTSEPRPLACDELAVARRSARAQMGF